MNESYLIYTLADPGETTIWCNVRIARLFDLLVRTYNDA